MNELPTNQIICGDCLEVMADWPEKFIQTCVTSPPLLVAILARLVESFSLFQDSGRQSAFLVLASMLPRGLRFFVTAQPQDALCLRALLNKIWQCGLNQGRGDFIRGAVDRHNLLAFEAGHALIDLRFRSQRAAEFVLDEFKNWATGHANLNTLRIRRRVNVRSVPHSPRRFLDSDVRLTVENSSNVCV